MTDITGPVHAYDTDASAHTPVREVTIGDHTLGDADFDIEIGHSRTGVHAFEVAVWNLDPAVWTELHTGDAVRIRLGWGGQQTTGTQGPLRTVLAGALRLKRIRSVGADRQFILRGHSDAYRALQAGHSKTWRDGTPTTITRDLAAAAGLRVGDVPADAPLIQGYWAVRRDRPVTYWLDRLTQEAAKRTGEQWHWYTHDGDKLSVVPKSHVPDPRLRLSYDRSLRRFTPSMNATGASRHAEVREREFVAHLEPHLDRGRTVEVPAGSAGDPTADDTTAHVVVSYTIASSTRHGTHEMRGQLVPAGASFPAHFPGDIPERRRAPGSPPDPRTFEREYPITEVDDTAADEEDFGWR